MAGASRTPTEPAHIRTAWICYGLSVTTIVVGVLLAARSYPGSFDWTYTVISALASRKHNPDGSFWFAGALGIALALLWPVSGVIRSRPGGTTRAARLSSVALRVGLVCGTLVGVERLVFFHLSDLVRKGHELLALIAFLAIYAGVLGLEFDHLRRRTTGLCVSVLVVVPLLAIGASELVLYLGQRGTGWLDHDWRSADLPVWARFAFWQWLAAAALWAGLGHLLLLARRSRS